MQSTLDRRLLLLRACIHAFWKPSSFSALHRHALRGCKWLLVLGLSILGSLAQAQTVEAARTRGLDWLQAQIGNDGALAGETASIAAAVQLRSEVALTLVQAGRGVPAALQSSLLINTGAEAEPLARKLVALHAAGVDASALTTALQALQRTDGGVSSTAEAGGGLLDTAWALRALASDSSRSDAAAAWLRERQSANGAWEVAPRSALISTANALRGLREIASRNAEAAASASSAASYLLAQRSGSGLWDSSIWLNALIFEAVHDYVAADAPLRGLVRDALVAAQAANGSWSGDPYITALALRALQLSALAPANPVLGRVQGRVVDASSGAPIQGVAALLDGAATGSATDVNGNFEVRNVAAGSHNLLLRLNDYGQVQAPLTIVADQTVDLGVISMVRSAGATTGVIRGQVVDAVTGQAIPSAAVVIDNGGISTSTATDGTYLVANVPAGSHTIRVSSGGFQESTASGSVAAGGTLVFSPRLVRTGEQPPPGDGVLVQGIVVHAGTGAPLAGAAVSVVLLGEDASGQTVTDANGRFTFTSISRTAATSGLIGVGVQLDGYATLTITTSMPSNVGTLRMVPAEPRRLLPDLFPANVNKSNVVTDAQRNTITGYVTFDVVNLGQTPAPAVLYTAFEDRNRNGRFDSDADLVLGTLRQEQPLAPSATAQLRIDVAGNVAFRGNQILIAADSDNAVVEGNEDNNIARCECFFGLPYIEDFNDGVADGARYIGNQAGQVTTWSVTNGYLQTPGGGGALFGRVEWTDYDAEVKVFFVNSVGNDAAIVFRAATDNSWYHFRFKSGHARLVWGVNGNYAIPVEVPFSVQPNRWYTLKVKVRGTSVETFIDDAPVFVYSNVVIPAGRVGVMQDAGGTVRYDDLRVFGGPVASFVDLTTSYVRVLDAGASGTSRITVRIGNGGTATVPAGAYVTLYRGTPSAANRVQTVQIPAALGPGEYRDVDFNLVGGLAGLGQVTIVVDDNGSGASLISECDESNNTITADLGTLAVALTLGVSANSPVYNELDIAQFTAAVSNPGSFAQAAQVRFSVETATGSPVQTLALPAAVGVAAAAQAPVNGPWPVAGVLAGEYRVRAELIDSAGVVYASALAPFRVEASNTAHVGARLSVDRARYSAGQSIQLRSRVHNATVNMLIDELVATTQIIASDNQVAWTRDESAVQIAAGNSREYTYTVPAADLLPGQYSAVLEVRDSLGNLRASSTALFTVLGTDFSGVGLRGTLEVPATVALGQTASIGFSAINGGNAALTNVPMTLRIVDPAAGVLRGEFPLSASLAIGATQAGAVNWQAAGQAGDVVAVLAATIGGREQVLAQAPFRLTGTQSAIDLGVTSSAARDLRVLALVSCLSGAVDEPNCLQQRANAVGSALAANGVPYQVVTTAAEFDAQMRCGIYNVYWISGGGRKLSEQVAKEVREAVRRGDGLILDGPQSVYDAQDEYLHAAAGVHLYDGTVGENLSAEVLPGSLFDAGSLQTLGSARPFIFTTGQPVAMFDPYYPAIAVNQYGQGKGVLFAFHFADMLAAPGGLSNASLQALLDDALQTIAPLPTLLTLADALRSGTEVHNRGGQVVDVDARTTLPLGSTYLDAVPVPAQIVPATSSSGQQVIWRFNLAAGERREFKVRHRLDVTGVTEVVVPTSVYSRNGSADPVLQGSASHALPVADGLALTNAAAAAVQALAPTGEFDQAVRGYALNATESAVQAYGQGDATQALMKWVMVADMVALISTDDVARIAAAQAAVAMAIEAATDKLCRP